MSDQTDTSATPQRRSFLSKLELDTRLLGMIGAFVIVCLVFNVLTEGRFLTPRNIFNLTIQTVFAEFPGVVIFLFGYVKAF